MQNRKVKMLPGSIYRKLLGTGTFKVHCPSIDGKRLWVEPIPASDGMIGDLFQKWQDRTYPVPREAVFPVDFSFKKAWRDLRGKLTVSLFVLFSFLLFGCDSKECVQEIIPRCDCGISFEFNWCESQSKENRPCLPCKEW